MAISLLVGATLFATQATSSEELREVTDTHGLAFAALVQCVDEKAETLDDGRESAKTIVEASLTACKDTRSKVIFLTIWKRRLEAKKGNEDAMKYALEYQKALDAKVSEGALLKLLEGRAAKAGRK